MNHDLPPGRRGERDHGKGSAVRDARQKGEVGGRRRGRAGKGLGHLTFSTSSIRQLTALDALR